MKIIADTHTHTLLSGHAYSTITENMAAAAQKGLRFLASTDHTGGMPDAPHAFHFMNQLELPDALFGVYLLRGCEVNIISAQGTLDLADDVLSGLEWVIASMHSPVFKPMDTDAHTTAWMAVARNPLVDVIGHCGDDRFRFDYESVIREFAAHGKIVEINAHSFGARPRSSENCREIAELCRKHGVPIVVSSDAHFHTGIGDFSNALNMLDEIGFPEGQVLNADYGRFAAMLATKTGRAFPPL